MLVALTENDELFQITPTITKIELQQLGQTTHFYCPQCKERLQLKIGQIKIPHFAHKRNSTCESTFSEGESFAHLLGKQQLQSLFLHLNMDTALEPYLPALQQRPDILVKKASRKIAIEFQCSRIALEQFTARTEGYIKHGITPVWILQTPNDRFTQRGIVKISLNHFVQQFIQYHDGQRYLLTYDVHTEQFYYVSNLCAIHGQQYFGFIQSIPLLQQAYPFYVPKLLSKPTYQMILMRYTTYRDQYVRSRSLLSRKGVGDLLLRSIYELRLRTDQLPCFIGIPMHNSETIDLLSVEWQVALFYFMHSHNLTPQTMNVQAIPYFFKWAKIAHCAQANEVVVHYIQLLNALQVQHAHSYVPQYKLFEILYSELVAIG